MTKVEKTSLAEKGLYGALGMILGATIGAGIVWIGKMENPSFWIFLAPAILVGAAGSVGGPKILEFITNLFTPI